MVAPDRRASPNASLKRQGLFPCEAEIARRLSQSERRWRALAPKLEGEGLPKIDALMGGRYWPAVKAFFDRRYHIGEKQLRGIAPVDAEDGEEHWELDAPPLRRS